jgi:outer membrane protein assembly factor BamA
LSIGHWLGPDWWQNFGYRTERTALNDAFQSRQSPQIPVGDGRLASLVYRQGFDTLDSFPFGNSGLKVDLTLEAARRSLGSRYDYNRLELDVYKPVSFGRRREHVLSLRSFLGLSSGNIPIYELFGVGGARENPFMGFNRRELLGKHFLTFNLNHRFLLYRFPMPESRALFGKLYWSTFMDGGFISDIIKNRSFGDFRHGYGVGLLLDTNFGLIKLIYGVNSERKGQLYLSLAYEI